MTAPLQPPSPHGNPAQPTEPYQPWFDPNARPVRTKRVTAEVWWVVASYAAALISSVVLILFGAGVLQPRSSGMEMIGAAGILLVLTLGPIAAAMVSPRRREQSGRSARNIEAIHDSVRGLHQQAGLSDDARRVLNRSTERALLCRAIEDDIARQEWDAAIVLCNELAERFGYRADAEEYRSRIEAVRSEVQERRVTEAVARLDGLIVQRRWEVALQEAARIRRLYPDSSRVEHLRERVLQARAVYKADLERRFLDAAEQNRIDDAMTHLKELDGYLSPSEGEQYREVARGVIGKARENLGAQFKIAVQDRRWSSAAAVGRRIVNEFPNTRMAEEVRGLLDGILSKANATQN